MPFSVFQDSYLWVQQPGTCNTPSEKDHSLIPHWIIYTVEGSGERAYLCVCLCVYMYPSVGQQVWVVAVYPWFMYCILTCKQVREERGGDALQKPFTLVCARASMERPFYSGPPPSWMCHYYIHRDASRTHPDQILNHLKLYFFNIKEHLSPWASIRFKDTCRAHRWDYHIGTNSK